MTKFTGVQANILKLYEADHNIVNNDNKLFATYWWKFDKLDYASHPHVLSMLNSVTPAKSIERARRSLHQHGHITYSPEADQAREIKYKEALDEYGQRVMVQL